MFTNLFIDFPLVLDGVTSQLAHCAFTEGAVQNEQFHFFEGLSLFFLLVNVLVRTMNLFLEHGC